MLNLGQNYSVSPTKRNAAWWDAKVPCRSSPGKEVTWKCFPRRKSYLWAVEKKCNPWVVWGFLWKSCDFHNERASYFAQWSRFSWFPFGGRLLLSIFDTPGRVKISRQLAVGWRMFICSKKNLQGRPLQKGTRQCKIAFAPNHYRNKTRLCIKKCISKMNLQTKQQTNPKNIKKLHVSFTPSCFVTPVPSWSSAWHCWHPPVRWLEENQRSNRNRIHGNKKGQWWIPSRKLTYPTWGIPPGEKEPYQGDMLIPWRVIASANGPISWESGGPRSNPTPKNRQPFGRRSAI